MRDDLLIGSACEHGALAKAIGAGKEWNELTQTAREFDYLEVSPVFVEDTVRTIIKLGRELSIPVCAVSDARSIKPEDEYLLRLHNGSDFKPPRYLYGIYSKNLLFSYLDEKTREEIILRNPAKVADMTETVSLFASSVFDADAARI
jgi:DNA polymerase III alpha subunit (gram-positive type)